MAARPLALISWYMRCSCCCWSRTYSGHCLVAAGGDGKITSSGTRLSTPNTPLKGVTPVTLDTVVRYANIASGTFCTHW